MFLTSRHLCIVMEYVAGGDLADLVDLWNVRNRRSHIGGLTGEPIPHRCAPPPAARLSAALSLCGVQR